MTLSAADMLLPPNERTLPRMLERQAAHYGDRELISCGEDSWSFREARDIAAGRGASLRAAGVSAGDRVAILCSNRLEMLEIILGCGWIGAIAVPINTAAMGPQIGYYLSNSGACLFAIEAQFVERLAHVTEGMESLRAIWVIGGDAQPSAASMEAMPPRGDAIAAAPINPGDTLAIIYTSGTTGPSKGVMCPHAQYYWWGVNSLRLLGVRSDDVLCTTLPLFHINALNTFAQALLSGGRMVLEPRFSASGFWPAMIRNEATVIYLLGAMVPILLAGEARANERAHKVRTGLGPGVPAELGAAFTARTGVQLLEGYGSTETNFVIGASPETQKPGTMGRVADGFQARVVDSQDMSCRPARPASWCCAPTSRLHLPVAISACLKRPSRPGGTSGSTPATGLSVMRAAISASSTGSRTRSAGAARTSLPMRSSRCCWRIPISTWWPCFPPARNWPRMKSWPRLSRDRVLRSPQVDLMQFCATRLPYFAVPRFVDFVADLPRTENGKVRKYELRERGVTASTWDREASGYQLKRGAK